MNNNFKIAVISTTAHYNIGGIENYCTLCYQDWISRYQIVEFPLWKTKSESKNQVRHKNSDVIIDYSLLGFKPYSILWAKTYAKSLMEKIYQEYDIVILNTTFPPRKWLRHPKSVLVQHMDVKWYGLGGKDPLLSIGQFFSSWLFGVGTFKSAFNKSTNIVFYAKETSTPNNAKNVFFVPLAHKKNNEIIVSTTPRHQFSSIGRLEKHQKNLKNLIKIANLNDDVFIYGAGPDIKMLRKKLANFSQFQGLLSHNNLDQTLKSTRALIMTSNYEGFSFIIVEALTNGTPVIAFDTFSSLRFFMKSQAVFVVPKNDVKAFNDKIAWIRGLSNDEYQKISNNAVKFAREHLSKELFWQNWTNVLETVITYNRKLT